MKSTENNILNISSTKCTGCYACSFVCPQSAILLKEVDGFRTATVNNQKCINCGLCLKVCHRINDEHRTINDSLAWEAYSNDESVLATSTSGGAAFELSRYFLKKGYKIVGCKYNYETDCAEHDIIDSESKIYLFTGSKYIQSSLENIKDKLLDNEKYVFIGTPCQCFGLKKYLNLTKKNSEFVFIDFFCHGFIPADFFTYFLAKNRKDCLQKIEFRSKERGWHSYLCKMTYKDNYALIPYQKSEFGMVFLSNFLLLKTCYQCKFRYNQISSDIRIGDYWGEKHKNNTKGVSCVIGVTENGKNLLNQFFSKNLMHSNRIDLREIRDAKCGNDNGIKAEPHFNSIFEIVYRMFGIRVVSLFIKIYLKLRGRI